MSCEPLISPPMQVSAVESLLAHSMQNAVYFCMGDASVDPQDYGHYALSVPLYTHFTSPIRRYADVVVHRQLQAVLDREAGSTAGAPYAAAQVQEGKG